MTVAAVDVVAWPAALAAMAAGLRVAEHERDLAITSTWVPAVAALEAIEDEARLAGQWHSGPHTIMAVLGITTAEVINCRMVRWLLDPLAPHGIGPALLRSFAAQVDAPLTDEDIARADVDVEITRDDTRADIVVTTPGRIIVVEAKFNAGEGREQGKRLEDWWSEADRFVFLTRKGTQLPRTATKLDCWRPLSWRWIAAESRRLLESAPASRTAKQQDARTAAETWFRSIERSER